MSAATDQELAELRRANAELQRERDAALTELRTRTTALAQRDSEFGERIDQQSATIEVLMAMSASPGDPRPVFEVIVRRARDLCDAYGATLAQVAGGSIVLRAYIVADEGEAKRHEASFPRPVAADTMFGRAILAREPVQLPDVAADQTYALREGTLRGAVRAQVAVPLMRDGEAIGAINITRRQTGEFSPAQIELLQVFASQAVIAITSAETYRALQEALEQQTATAEVLQVINSSPGDLVPVFDAILEKAHSLCDIAQGSLELYDGQNFRAVAIRGVADSFADQLRQGYPASDNPATRPLIEGQPFSQILDVTQHEFPFARDRGSARTLLCVPLRRDDKLLGMIACAPGEVRPFSEREIALLQNFAAQAVIAMDNARLMTETREALEQQTATAEVLQVINSSPGNLTPVFEAMLEKAIRLCGGDRWPRPPCRIPRPPGGIRGIAT
jgi:GAF domain-containing protein